MSRLRGFRESEPGGLAKRQRGDAVHAEGEDQAPERRLIADGPVVPDVPPQAEPDQQRDPPCAERPQGKRGSPDQAGRVLANRECSGLSREQEACGDAVGQHQPDTGSQAGQDRRNQRMTRSPEPQSEHVDPGHDREEAEHPVRGLNVGHHPCTENRKPDHQRSAEHEEPDQGGSEQCARQPGGSQPERACRDDRRGHHECEGAWVEIPDGRNGAARGSSRPACRVGTHDRSSFPELRSPAAAQPPDSARSSAIPCRRERQSGTSVAVNGRSKTGRQLRRNQRHHRG